MGIVVDINGCVAEDVLIRTHELLAVLLAQRSNVIADIGSLL